MVQKMTITDSIYSNFEITSPVALELIGTRAFQRLRGVSQFGIPSRYYHLEGFSRYEHSIGAYIMLNRLGASEEEQIAGLLHDISHTAFSHLVDWVIGDSMREDYQDKRHLSVLKEDEVARILKKYGMSPENVADYQKFGLLERDLPDLCADRIDYVLRESPRQTAELCLPHLKVVEGKIVFSSEKYALLFARNFLTRQRGHWAGYQALTRYVLLSDLLKRAIQDKIIVLEDFFKTDAFVLSKIISANKKKYTDVLHLLEKKDLSFLPRSQVTTQKKFRFVDPEILIQGNLIRLSERNNEFREELEQAKFLNKKGTHCGVLPQEFTDTDL